MRAPGPADNVMDTNAMDITIERVKNLYPLHYSIWNDDTDGLDKLLSANLTDDEPAIDIELQDPRGRTPLMLSVCLVRIECVRILLKYNADISASTDNWTVSHEALATGNMELARLIFQHKATQRYNQRVRCFPKLIERLKNAPDFYVEMKWQFTSWVPLVPSACPMETFKIFKLGSRLRVDWSHAAYENLHWQSKNTSWIVQESGLMGSLVEIQHEAKKVYIDKEQAFLPSTDRELVITEKRLAEKISSPIVTNYLDVDKITFERSKSGIWGWRQDKFETVNNYVCKVFTANLELLTKTRSEHLDRKVFRDRTAGNRHRLSRGYQPLLTSPGDEIEPNPSTSDECTSRQIGMSLEEYFTDRTKSNDITFPRNIETKVRKYKAVLSLCEDYPLNFQEQVMPIVDLMAMYNSHFQKLKDFIEMQLPSGFPVKIETPVVHLLNVAITFNNIFASESEVTGVISITDDNGHKMCYIDESVFYLPDDYEVIAGQPTYEDSIDEEEEEIMRRFAMPNSLMNHSSFRRPSNAERRSFADEVSSAYSDEDYEEDLQMAIQLSLMDMNSNSTVEVDPSHNYLDPSDLQHDLIDFGEENTEDGRNTKNSKNEGN